MTRDPKRRITVELTQPELDALVSFCELVDEATSVTFGTWAEANRDQMKHVRRAELKLRKAEMR